MKLPSAKYLGNFNGLKRFYKKTLRSEMLRRVFVFCGLVESMGTSEKLGFFEKFEVTATP